MHFKKEKDSIKLTERELVLNKLMRVFSHKYYESNYSLTDYCSGDLNIKVINVNKEGLARVIVKSRNRVFEFNVPVYHFKLFSTLNRNWIR